MTVIPMTSVPEPLPSPTADWLRRVQAEYREMPGLSLTKPQMQRLWGLDATICDALIEALVRAGVLRRAGRGAYVSARSAV